MPAYKDRYPQKQAEKSDEYLLFVSETCERNQVIIFAYRGLIRSYLLYDFLKIKRTEQFT